MSGTYIIIIIEIIKDQIQNQLHNTDHITY